MTLRFRRALAGSILVAALALSGCGVPTLARDDVDGMAKLKAKCESAGGEFNTWTNEFGWHYECDLSTNPEEKR